jgi:hypothetical protein
MTGIASLQAQHLASQGRNGDSMLVHMNPSEVAALNSIRPLTTNPHTGLPEAFDLSDIIGPLLGLGSMFIPGVGPMAAAAINGGVTALAKHDLGAGIASGLLSYGIGSGIDALAGPAGTAAGETIAETAPGLSTAATDAASQAATAAPSSVGGDLLSQAHAVPLPGETAASAVPSIAGQGASEVADPSFSAWAQHATDMGAGTAPSPTGFMGKLSQAGDNLMSGNFDTSKFTHFGLSNPLVTGGAGLLGLSDYYQRQALADQAKKKSSTPWSTKPTGQWNQLQTGPNASHIPGIDDQQYFGWTQYAEGGRAHFDDGGSDGGGKAPTAITDTAQNLGVTPTAINPYIGQGIGAANQLKSDAQSFLNNNPSPTTYGGLVNDRNTTLSQLPAQAQGFAMNALYGNQQAPLGQMDRNGFNTNTVNIDNTGIHGADLAGMYGTQPGLKISGAALMGQAPSPIQSANMPGQQFTAPTLVDPTNPPTHSQNAYNELIKDAANWSNDWADSGGTTIPGYQQLVQTRDMLFSQLTGPEKDAAFAKLFPGHSTYDANWLHSQDQNYINSLKPAATTTPSGTTTNPTGPTYTFGGKTYTTTPNSTVYDVSAIAQARPDLIGAWDAISTNPALASQWGNPQSFDDFLSYWSAHNPQDANAGSLATWKLTKDSSNSGGSGGGSSGGTSGSGGTTKASPAPTTPITVSQPNSAQYQNYNTLINLGQTAAANWTSGGYNTKAGYENLAADRDNLFASLTPAQQAAAYKQMYGQSIDPSQIMSALHAQDAAYLASIGAKNGGGIRSLAEGGTSDYAPNDPRKYIGLGQFFNPWQAAAMKAAADQAQMRDVNITDPDVLQADKYLADYVAQQSQTPTQPAIGPLGRADGGIIPMAPFYGGYLHGTTEGRADRLHTDIPAGSYVIPADVVTALGDGNGVAGGAELDKVFHRTAVKRSGGGGITTVPVALSHGEYVIGPDEVDELGDGDNEKGARRLDEFVLKTRKKYVNKLSKLPPPKK